jgi:hypothetical protein
VLDDEPDEIILASNRSHLETDSRDYPRPTRIDDYSTVHHAGNHLYPPAHYIFSHFIDSKKEREAMNVESIASQVRAIASASQKSQLPPSRRSRDYG